MLRRVSLSIDGPTPSLLAREGKGGAHLALARRKRCRIAKKSTAILSWVAFLARAVPSKKHLRGSDRHLPLQRPERLPVVQALQLLLR